MNFDVLFLLGMGLFYLLRKISRQNKERARQFQLEQMEREALGGDQAGALTAAQAKHATEPVEPESKTGSFFASISAMIEAEAARQAEAEKDWHAENDRTAGQRPATRSRPDRDIPERVDTEFHAAADPFESEWHTETREDWSDQKSDYDFHSSFKESTFAGDSFGPKKSDPADADKTQETADDPFADDGARHAPGLAELDRRRPSHKLRSMYQSKNTLAEAIILSEIIGLPVSRRTRSARRRLS